MVKVNFTFTWSRAILPGDEESRARGVAASEKLSARVRRRNGERPRTAPHDVRRFCARGRAPARHRVFHRLSRSGPSARPRTHRGDRRSRRGCGDVRADRSEARARSLSDVRAHRRRFVRVAASRSALRRPSDEVCGRERYRYVRGSLCELRTGPRYARASRARAPLTRKSSTAMRTYTPCETCCA